MDALERLAAEINRPGEARFFAYPHDVVDTQGARAVFDRIVTELDGLDAIVYAAGVMPRVREDQFDGAIDRQIVEVNVIGAMAWLDLAAERFQVQRGGMIVGLGSVAGDRGRRGQPAYCASKAALHTYLEAQRNRLSQHGVHVLTVKPGPVHTPMTQGLDKMPMAIDADACVEGIVRAMNRRAYVAYVPFQWGIIMPIIQSIPSLLFRRMSL